MRDIVGKMAELKFEAPLAQFEEADDWGSIEFQSNTIVKNNENINNINLNNINLKEPDVFKNEDIILNENSNIVKTSPKNNIILKNDTNSVADNFTETFSGSLEDLVNTFDEKITKCFGNYDENVEKLAPVQIRSQEEIMNECQ